MKVNLKQGRQNHTVCDTNDGNGRLYISLNVKAPGRSTMILGADATHPGKSSFIGRPSIAILVGSVDKDAGKFLGSARLQAKSKKKASNRKSREV